MNQKTTDMTKGSPIRLLVTFAIPLLDVWGIWWSVGVVWFLSGFTAWLRYLWYKKKKLTDTGEQEPILAE